MEGYNFNLRFGFYRWVGMLFIGIVAQTSAAQVQFIGSMSSSHFLGDLGGKGSAGTPGVSDINIASTRYAFSGGIRLHVNPYFAVKSVAYYGRLSADDKYTSYLPRRNRNLNFFTPIYGVNLMLEAHFGFKKSELKRFFVSTGIEYFHFNPMTKYNGQKVALQPLGTEGQNFMPNKSPYELNSWALPIGIGYKFIYFPAGFLSMSICARKTNTDYLDDASTTYPDKAALLASDGQMAVDLSDRSLGNIQGFSDAGSLRASSDYNDNFFFISLEYNHNIGGGKTYRKTKKAHHGSRFGGRSSCFSF